MTPKNNKQGGEIVYMPVLDCYVRSDGRTIKAVVWECVKKHVCRGFRYDLDREGFCDGGARRIHFAHCLDFLINHAKTK